MERRVRCQSLLLVLFCSIPAHSASITLSPGQTLRITFTTGSSAANALELRLPGGTEVTGATATLYDGDLLLSIAYPVVGGTPATWRSTDVNYLDGTPIDFTSIRNGSIQGRIDVTISTGTLQFEYPPVLPFAPGLLDLVAYPPPQAPGVITPGHLVPISVGAVQIVTPESSSVPLVGLGLLFFLALSRFCRGLLRSVSAPGAGVR